MRWRKVAGDLRLYRLQIVVIVLVLMVGAAGVTAALNAQAVLKREIASNFAAAKSADIALWFDRVEPPLLAAVAGGVGSQDAEGTAGTAFVRGVAAVDARRVVLTRVAAPDGTWLPMLLTVMRDFSAQQLDIVHLHNGAWPLDNGSIWVEQSAQSLLGLADNTDTGVPLRMRTLSGVIMELPLAGFVHDTAVAPSAQERMLYGYITPATATKLGLSSTLDQLLVKMDYRTSAAEAKNFGEALQAALVKQGTPALRMEVLPAGHPHADLMNAMLRVLGVLAGMAFVCSAALVSYVVAAWMRREVRVVGIMKTMGASSYQIGRQYLALVVPAVLVAMALGLPLGNLLGRLIVGYYAVSLNIDIASGSVPAALLWREIVLALCIPLIAMTLPILRASRMTAHNAMHDVGITALSGKNGFASRHTGRFAGWFMARFMTRFIRLPGHVCWTLAIRNTWRRPWRVMMILLGLTAGGALLLMTHNNYESFLRVIDTSLANQGHDIEVLMQHPVPAAQLEAVAHAVPGVKIAEAWRRARVNLLPVGSTSAPSSSSRSSTTGAPPLDEIKDVALTGYPRNTQLFKLPFVQGRAPHQKLSADAPIEVVITRALQDAFPQLQVGYAVAVRFGKSDGRDEKGMTVKIVGVVEEIAKPALYAEFAAFDALTGLGDSSALLRVKTNDDQIELVVKMLDQALLDARMIPAQIISRTVVRDSLEEHFKVVGDVIRMVALAAALVGAIMLAATTILNIAERTREIGILRTLGATPRGIAALFLAEGASITLLSFILSVGMSIVLTLAILRVAERTMLHMAVPLHFSMQGLAILCSGAIVVLLTVVLAVAHALRKSIRETIAYE